MKLRNVKRLCGLLLAVVLVGSSSVQYAGVTKAATDEPSFSEATDNLLYNKETLSMEQGSKSFDVTVPENQTYYVSFTVKTAGEVYFDYRGSNHARLYLGQTQRAFLGLSKEQYTNGQYWPQGDVGLNSENGVKITLRSDPDKTTLWVNGEKKAGEENLPIETTEAGTPKISWASTTTTFTNIKIWTEKDEPIYNAETDTMKYKATEVTMESGSKDFGVRISGDTTYFGTFTVKTEGSVWFNYRGTDDAGGRLYLAQSQCGFVGLASDKWPQGNKGLSTTGIKVTFRSDPDKTTIWINGEKLLDNGSLAEGTTGLVGAPKVSSVTKATTITDIAIWKTKDANDEPIYDKTQDKLYDVISVADGCTYEDRVLTVPATTDAKMQTELPSNAAYYMTMQVQTSNYVNIMTRTGSYINIQPGGYELVGTTGDKWEGSSVFSKLGTGVKITLYSDAVGFRMWVDGEKAIEAQYSTENSSAKPNISYSFNGQVTASDIQIWTLNVAELAGTSITLDGNVGVNLYMSLGTAVNPEDAVMNFTLPDGSTQEVTGTLDTEQGYYKYTCEVAAKQMTKDIKAQVVAGDAVSKEYSYSVRAYADAIFSDEIKYAEEIPLVKAMLNYGAYAQTYFNYNTEVLANTGLKETDKVVSSVIAETLQRFEKDAQSNSVVALAGASLILESETTLKLYFKLADGEDVNDYIFTSGSEPLTPVKSKAYYYVSIQNIDAKSLDETYEVTVTSGENSLVASYSPMTYCYNVLKGSYDENLQNVVRALYLYNAAANVYFESNN